MAAQIPCNRKYRPFMRSLRLKMLQAGLFDQGALEPGVAILKSVVSLVYCYLIVHDF